MQRILGKLESFYFDCRKLPLLRAQREQETRKKPISQLRDETKKKVFLDFINVMNKHYCESSCDKKPQIETCH